MKYQKWHIGTASEQDTALLKEAGYPSLLATVLAARGITTAEAAAPTGRTRPAAAGRSGPARTTGAAGAPIIIRRSAPPSAGVLHRVLSAG